MYRPWVDVPEKNKTEDVISPSSYMTYRMPQDIKQQCKNTFYCLRILYESAGTKISF